MDANDWLDVARAIRTLQEFAMRVERENIALRAENARLVRERDDLLDKIFEVAS